MKKCLSGEELGKIVGVSRSTILDYETGRLSPSLDMLHTIADALGINADKLYDDYYRFLIYPCSKKIKEIRVKNKLLQRELEDMLGISHISGRWERGEISVTRKMWTRIKKLNLL
jgi:transcriptional regulator with XRE-family HTH domain